MAGKRISELTALSGAASANNDDLLIFDSGAGETKRISRSQLADGMVGDLPYTPAGFVSATTVPTAIAEIVTDLTAAGGAALIGNTPAGPSRLRLCRLPSTNLMRRSNRSTPG
jgi:hypothetical protein